MLDLPCLQVLVTFLELPELAILQCVDRYHSRLYNKKSSLWRICLWHNGCANRCRLAYWQNALDIHQIQQQTLRNSCVKLPNAHERPSIGTVRLPVDFNARDLEERSVEFYQHCCIWDEEGIMRADGKGMSVKNATKRAVGVEREILLDVGRTYPNRCK